METIWKHQKGKILALKSFLITRKVAMCKGLLTVKEGVATMEHEEIIKTFEVIKKSGELVFEHFKAGGFKNSLIEVGIQNIIGTCDTALEQIAKENGERKGGRPCDTTT